MKNNSSFRWTGLPLALLMLLQSLIATPLYGLSGGPGQPEFQQTSVVGADNLVDPFSGNLNYSIPLFEIGGYPINLTYTSDHKMEEEASWVGFGWTLNPGAISRQVRGLPDDFRGDMIEHRGHVRPSVTTGITPGARVELFGGYAGLATSLDFSYNNYAGYHLNRSLSPSINIARVLGAPGEDGEAENPSSFGAFLGRNNIRSNLSATFSSRSGLQGIAYGVQQGIFSQNHAHSFGGFTYTPVSDLPRSTVAGTFQVNAGAKFFFPDASMVTLAGYAVTQALARTLVRQPAYGYLYLDEAQGDRTSLMDYNVEKGGMVDENSPRLSMPFGTPDVFSVTGSGMSGQIEVTRNDLGEFRPAYVSSNSLSSTAGVELAAGNILHSGIEIDAAVIKTDKGAWADANLLGQKLGFRPNTPTKESVYMRMVGDRTAHTGREWYAAIGNEDAITTRVFRRGNQVGLNAGLVSHRWASSVAEDFLGYPAPTVFRTRRPRANVVTYLSAIEATHIGSLSSIERFRPFTAVTDNFAEVDPLPSLSRVDFTAGRQAHHLSEINITSSSGQRFVYGLPVYNTLKEETTFNAAGLRSSGTDSEGSGDFGMVSYRNNLEAVSVRNDLGSDQYFDQVITGGYPSAHLLTSVLSPDYMDRLGDGPSLDDAGSYVKIGYSAVTKATSGSPNANLGWRTPMGEYQAVFYEGNVADQSDDKGSFVYGEKEVYYVHHMDSKTHRAVFITSPRSDARPVNRHGEVQAAVLQQLDSIKIYTLAELRTEGSNAEPLKTVHFTYKADGSPDQISGNLVNATAGKLTLHSVSFTYADNERGRENPYTFQYRTRLVPGDDATKVDYQPFMTDRWGTQRGPVASPLLNPMSYPYASQDAEEAEKYCALGNLTRIGLPSGAEIKVSYEPDDYAYVQDKRAGRMYPLLGFSEYFNPNEPAEATYDDELYRQNLGVGVAKLYAYVDVGQIPRRADGSLPAADRLKQLYLQDVDQLYFNARVSLLGTPQTEERVAGYAQFDQNFVAALPGAGPDEHDVIVVKFRAVDRNNRETGREDAIHPITYTALSKMRNELPRLLYANSPAEERVNPLTMLAFLKEEGLNIRNYYARRINQIGGGDARQFRPEGSFVRLTEATYAKYGDGSRVARVELNDNWLTDGGDSDPDRHASTYVKAYAYTTMDPLTKELISSGVAANEPMAGKEEMLLVNQEKSSKSNFLAPDNTYYNEAPLGLQFFPGQQVGYAEVTVTMALDANYRQSKPGSTVYQYYTARDFPVIASATDPDRASVRPLPSTQPFVSIVRNRLAVSQGFSIQVNDMHGKMKSTEERAHDGEVISSTVYRYSELPAAGASSRKRLNNYLDVVLPPSTTANTSLPARAAREELGLDVDLWVETAQENSQTIGGGASINPELSYLPPFFPLVGVFVLPRVTEAQNSLQTATFTKLIRRYGMLESVTVTNNGSSLTTTNHRWDALTGSPVLTSTENEWGQPIYTQTLPAYWMQQHAGMGAAYVNQGLNIEFARVVGGVILTNSSNIIDQNSLLEAGDEVVAYLPPFSDRPLRHRFYAVPFEGNMILIDETGKKANTAKVGIYTSLFNIRILRSGNRNVLTASAGQTTSLRSPLDPVGYWPSEATDMTLLTSSATEYSENWGGQCDSITTYSYATPRDSTVVPVDPGGGECETLAQKVRTYVPEYSYRSNGEPCEVKGVDWLTDVDQLESCDLCSELFERYTSFDLLIGGIDRYGTCNSSSGFASFTSDSAQLELIKSCDFVRNDLYGHLQGSDALLNLIQTSNRQSGCEDRNPSGEILCTDNGGNFSRIRSSLAPKFESCLAWNSEDDQNPYLTGRRGNWRTKASWVAKQETRRSARINGQIVQSDGRDNEYGQPLLYRDGTFDGYIPFWHNGIKLDGGSSHQLTSQILRYDDRGHELETKDALGIASGAQYGFNQELPTAIAQNARNTDLGYDGFEDYQYDRGAPVERWLRHFGMLDSKVAPDDYGVGPTKRVAHTGMYSYETTNGGSSISQTFATYACRDVSCPGEQEGCPCVTGFRPTPNQRYLVSAWIASDGSLDFGSSPSKMEGSTGVQSASNSISLSVTTANSTGTQPAITAYPYGPIVEGWQQVALDFTLPADATAVTLRLSPPTSTSGDYHYFFDDVRIQPFEADMTTYAYDPTTLRLMAQMDDRGYAVFYEYDDEGMLVRQKRETERGVMTITEQHTNLAPVVGEK